MHGTGEGAVDTQNVRSGVGSLQVRRAAYIFDITTFSDQC